VVTTSEVLNELQQKKRTRRSHDIKEKYVVILINVDGNRFIIPESSFHGGSSTNKISMPKEMNLKGEMGICFPTKEFWEHV